MEEKPDHEPMVLDHARQHAQITRDGEFGYRSGAVSVRDGHRIRSVGEWRRNRLDQNRADPLES